MTAMPALRPDGLANGYLGEVGIFNGFQDAEAALKHLRGRYGYRDRKELISRPAISVLAEALKMDPCEFARLHTMFPLLKGVVGNSRNLPYGDETQPEVTRKLGLRLPLQDVHCCLECIKEDLDFWGYGYWRRGHHIPGVDWCLKHECTLSKVISDNPFSHLPEDVVTERSRKHEEIADDAMKNAVLQRYAELTCDLLVMRSPMDGYGLVEKMRKRAAELNLRVILRDKKANLSDYARERIPESWLRQYQPEILAKRFGQHVPFDAVLCQTTFTCKTIHYALAMALLFNEPGEIIDGKVGRQVKQKEELTLSSHHLALSAM